MDKNTSKAPGGTAGTPALTEGDAQLVPHHRAAAEDLKHLETELRSGRAETRSYAAPRLVRIPDGKGGTTLVDVAAPPPSVSRIQEQNPRWLSYADLSVLQDADPELAAEAWERIRETARRELETGHYAASSIEGAGASPYTRALYLEVRADLVRQWVPTGAVELMLIDTLSQAFVLRNRWLGVAMNYGEPPNLNPVGPRPEEAAGVWEERKREMEHARRMEESLPPRLPMADATDRALLMAERFERTVNRTVRALRDLRRFSGPTNIQAGLVNIANGPQQVNVNAEER
jgi:hypothetical protein